MYKIGDFSKIVDIPVRTLRYYDEAGVLTPSNIDIFTGYRYYSEEDILECELIKLLKSLDFTLEEIKAYKDSLDQSVIEMKMDEIEQRIYLLKLKYERLAIMHRRMQQYSNEEFTPDTKRLILRREDEEGEFRTAA